MSRSADLVRLLRWEPTREPELSWGDAEETIEAYEDLGFDVVERVQGWELEL